MRGRLPGAVLPSILMRRRAMLPRAMLPRAMLPRALGRSSPVRPPAALLIALLFLLLGACQSADEGDPGGEGEAQPERPAQAAETTDSTIAVGSFVPRGSSGELMVSEDRAQFRACDGAEWRTVRERTPDTTGDLAQIARELGSGQATLPAHLVFDDSGDRVTGVRVVLPEGAGCPDVLPDTELQARGNEPFWSVDIEGAEARFRTPERIDGVPFDGGRWEAVGPDTWRFEAGELEVRITEERCRDSMSGAWYPFSARVGVGEDDYTGCALEGRRAHGS